MRFLLVDDSHTMRRMQKNILAKLELTDVLEAGDGDDALAKLQSASPPVDVVFLDWNMPKMDGLTCLRRIRENEAWKTIKVVMVTSESEKNKVLDAIKAGANNYLCKPFDPDTVGAKLRDLKVIE